MSDPRDTPYARWLSALPYAKGAGGSSGALDDAPESLDELRDYFVEITERQLASCWVGAVVDAATRPFLTADLARALIVVARRLTHVRLPEEILLMADSNLMPRPKAAAPAGRSAPPLRRPEPADPDAPAPAFSPPAGDGWAVETTGPMPLSSRRGIDPSLVSAVARLAPPPARIRLDGKRFTGVKVAKIVQLAKEAGGPADLHAFKAADGFRIIARRPGGGA